jgi:hypothetical protein
MWIEALTGRTTIKAHQGGKAPDLPYVMVNMTGMFEVREHPQDIEYEDADTGDMGTGDVFPDVTATPIIEAEWRFSVHAYGSNPTDLLRPVVSAVKLAQMQEPLMPGLIIHEISQIRNVPDWINEQWQPRAQMDINVRGLIKDGHVIDVIEEAPLDIDRA